MIEGVFVKEKYYTVMDQFPIKEKMNHDWITPKSFTFIDLLEKKDLEVKKMYAPMVLGLEYLNTMMQAWMCIEADLDIKEVVGYIFFIDYSYIEFLKSIRDLKELNLRLSCHEWLSKDIKYFFDETSKKETKKKYYEEMIESWKKRSQEMIYNGIL